MKLLDLSSLYKYTPKLLEYYHILSPEIPEFILEYSNTQEMLKQQYISVTCGKIYSKLFDYNDFTYFESPDLGDAMTKSGDIGDQLTRFSAECPQ